ncbi:hypothetical protein K7432_000662 [Basidiobolus ranarum]|uniref:Uncharacterized protein n=1 Tax=Basidiobolus ranarum TaxID=34480 RepID=A0ABR2X4B9_9FUNG
MLPRGSLKTKRTWILLLLIVVFGAILCAGHKLHPDTSDESLFQGTTEELVKKYHGEMPAGDPADCPFHKFFGLSSKPSGGSVIKGDGKSTFSFLFSESPMISSFLATAYISLFPNFILFFVPPNIRPSSLNILVSFAVGGLLGDVFLHLLPQAFLGEHGEGTKLDEETLKWRNLYVGLGVFGGFLFFFLMDKFMRLASGGSGHSHSHSHSPQEITEGKSTSVTETETDTQLRQRKKTDNVEKEKTSSVESTTQNINLSAYLNLIADMTHNFTDGLAIAASFYTSPAIGMSTFAAVFFHEIPHEVGDYAILIQSGFSRSSALGAQFVTAIGAFLGTVAGVVIEEATRNPDLFPILNGVLGGESNSIITASEMIIPATAGGFIYIATVGVIPELLAEDSSLTTLREKITDSFWQIIAMFVGVGLMVGITILEEM